MTARRSCSKWQMPCRRSAIRTASLLSAGCSVASSTIVARAGSDRDTALRRLATPMTCEWQLSNWCRWPRSLSRARQRRTTKAYGKSSPRPARACWKSASDGCSQSQPRKAPVRLGTRISPANLLSPAHGGSIVARPASIAARLHSDRVPGAATQHHRGDLP